MPAAQFANRKGLGCTDALRTISHHRKKTLDAGMESYIVQLDFSAAFDRASHSGVLFKLISIGVYRYKWAVHLYRVPLRPYSESLG